MKQNNVFLFYYALTAVTILLAVSFFFLPANQKIINVILLAPVVFYLWVNALSPDYFSTPRWSPKLGAISIVFCLLGIFSYFVSTKMPNYLPDIPVATTKEVKTDTSTVTSVDNTELKEYFDKKFETLNTKIDNVGKQDFSVLGLTVPPSTQEEAVIGQIEAKDANLTEIPVYETASTEAQVLGSAKFGIRYSYTSKIDNWYKITEGWVEARWFNEVTP